MSVVADKSSKIVYPEKSVRPAVMAAMIAGACTFLNVYCTQPLLPFFQHFFNASEFTVSLTVSVVSGTVFGGFLGRFLTGLIVTHLNWRTAFLTLGFMNLLGAFAVRQWLPLAVNFVPAKHIYHSLEHAWGHLKNSRLLAVCGMGFTILFTLVGTFTYVNFHLARPPFNLGPAGLGSIFAVYLLGCIVTPLSGRFLDLYGSHRMALMSVGTTLFGLALTLASSLTLVIAGLALFSTGIFISQSFATVLTGRVTDHARSAAAGLYVTFYYAGGSVGTTANFKIVNLFLTAYTQRFWITGAADNSS